MEKSEAKRKKMEMPGYSISGIKKSLEPRIREWRFSLYLMRKSLLALVGLVIVIVMVLIAIFAPVLAPTLPGHDPMQIPRDYDPPKPPGAEGHLLGTGFLGGDIYYGIIWGARTSIQIAIFVVVFATVVGLVLGAVSGYFGGAIDEALMRVTDVFLSVPALILCMAVAAVLSRTLENIMLALTIVWWPPYARLVRGQVLSIRESTYVEAARAVGAKRSRILFRHIVPNSLSPIIVNMTMDFGVVVLVAAGLSYIGFGAPAGTAEWGKMVSDGQAYFLSTVPYPYPNGTPYTPWWMVTFPGLMIFLFVMGFNLLGDGLRDILDPRLRR
ncbi:MAG: ABC transporter permease [Methanomassiliicoccales archaeon]|jgi:peptide/nickel transport system permease protein